MAERGRNDLTLVGMTLPGGNGNPTHALVAKTRDHNLTSRLKPLSQKVYGLPRPNGTTRTGTSLERLNQAHRRRSQQAQVQELRDRHAGRLRDLERAATARIAQETEAREQIATERDAERRQHEQELAQLRADNARREREVRQAREDLAREQADRADELAQIQYQAAAPATTPAPDPGQPPTTPRPTVQPMEDGPGFRLPNPEPFTGVVGKAKTFLLQLQSKINGEPKLRNDDGLQISYASLLLRDSAVEWALGYKRATEGTLERSTLEDFLKDFRYARPADWHLAITREGLITLAINIEGAHKGQGTANPSYAQAASGMRSGGSFKAKGKAKADHKGKEEPKPK
ncbi:MAG: hypothetical protein M1816_001345, partial [Peltula sp. TS41687]